MQQAVRDALIAFMAATSQAQAEATKAAQRAGIEHAKQNDQRAYLGRKPSFTREQVVKVRAMLGQRTVGIALGRSPWPELRGCVRHHSGVHAPWHRDPHGDQQLHLRWRADCEGNWPDPTDCLPDQG